MSMSTKKRKRDSVSEQTPAFKLSTYIPADVGPLLVSFPAVEAPPSTAFNCYSRKRARPARGDDPDRSILIAGETENVEFASNEDETHRAARAGCGYLLAVRNKKTSAITLLSTPIYPHILTQTVKALKAIPPAPAPSALEYKEARNALGETFGTKKAKANIRAQERNRVDVSAMEGVVDSIMDGIDKGSGGLLTTEEAKFVADSNRLIPQFDATATDPADVYPLHNIIPEAEWKMISVVAFDDAQNDKERIALLAMRGSKWLNDHIKMLNATTQDTTAKSRKKTMKILFYISAMMAFRRIVGRGVPHEKTKVQEKLSGVPTAIVDSFLARFTELPRGQTEHIATSAKKTSLLTHLLALCLRVDRYASDSDTLAHDLSLGVTAVRDLFKTLGCKIVKLGERERLRLGIADSRANEKWAVLSAPVVFPKPRAGKRKT
ncbi:RNA polymerase I associated factor, A49-like protein [Infundibulicybe gibba]|nr:RNA polymerase I associated factor, A49-like protein [Infundibulicybe gibba]